MLLHATSCYFAPGNDEVDGINLPVRFALDDVFRLHIGCDPTSLAPSQRIERAAMRRRMNFLPSLAAHPLIQLFRSGVISDDERLTDQEKRSIRSHRLNGNSCRKQRLEQGEPRKHRIDAAGFQIQTAIGFLYDRPAELTTGWGGRSV
jgi:hypothetical protein